MNEEYKIIGVGYVEREKMQYDWSYVKTSCTLNQEQVKALKGKSYWMRTRGFPNCILLSKNVAEQTSIETDLTAMSVSFTTENVAPTEREKQAIINAKVKRRDQIKAVIEKDAQIAVEIPSLAAMLTTINNISNLNDAKKIMKKLVKVIAYLHDLS